VLSGSFKIDFEAENAYRFESGLAAAFVGLNRFERKRVSRPKPHFFINRERAFSARKGSNTWGNCGGVAQALRQLADHRLAGFYGPLEYADLTIKRVFSE
jgi:hypothetical protein